MSRIAKSVLVLALIASTSPVGLTNAADLTPQQLADARARVEVAATLAAIGKAENDGDMLLVAAKLLAKAGGPVAVPGEPLKEGKPTAFDIKGLLAQAKAAGANTDAAEKAAMSMQAPSASYCYWYYSCDSYATNCQWLYIC
jgi:hypothetical protein